MRALVFVSVAVAAASLSTLAPAQQGRAPTAASYAAVLSDASRPAADKERDAVRKPAEFLAFARVRPGQRVADLLPGGGYFTRLFSKAVGEKGRVLAVVGPPPANGAAPPVAAVAAAPGYGNITVVSQPFEVMAPPESLDLVWTSQNYHDIKNRPGDAAKAVNDGIFKALKPGGTYVVLDHSAAAGSGFGATNTLHRVDKEAVKAEVLKSGFVFDGESTLLASPADDRTKRVFDPAIRGKTDQFALRFRKPR